MWPGTDGQGGLSFKFQVSMFQTAAVSRPVCAQSASGAVCVSSVVIRELVWGVAGRTPHSALPAASSRSPRPRERKYMDLGTWMRSKTLNRPADGGMTQGTRRGSTRTQFFAVLAIVTFVSTHINTSFPSLVYACLLVGRLLFRFGLVGLLHRLLRLLLELRRLLALTRRLHLRHHLTHLPQEEGHQRPREVSEVIRGHQKC